MSLSVAAVSSWSATVSSALPKLPARKSAVSSRRLQVTASGKGKATDFQKKSPMGPSGDYRFKVDASGSPSKGKGTFYLGKKYNGNIDGYSPIYNPKDWSLKGSTYEPGVEAAPRPISFQFDETSFSFSFTPLLAAELKQALDKLLLTFREKEKATRPQRWSSLEFRHASEGVSVEVFCNPNAYTNAFQAKALVTVKTAAMTLSSEGPLSMVRTSVEDYLSSS